MWNCNEKDTTKTDRMIDQKVYELYGLMEEIKVVEGESIDGRG
jgi:hypothetical protein